MIELVVFDIAGTTIRDNHAVRSAYRDTLKQHGILVRDEQLAAVLGMKKTDAIRQLLSLAGLTPQDEIVQAIHQDFVQHMQNHYAHDPLVGEMPGATEVFRALRNAGIKVALNTGFSRGIVDVLLQRLGWSVPSFIDATVTSDEVPRGRPYPDMIHHLMAQLEIRDPARVAKIGDTPVDLEEGKLAGCGPVIGVTSGGYSAEQLAMHHHTHILGSIAELPKLLLRYV